MAQVHDRGDSDDWSELCIALGGSDTSWTGRFLKLVAKSDPQHRAQLRRAAPDLVAGWEAWMTESDGTGRGVAAARAAFEAVQAGDDAPPRGGGPPDPFSDPEWLAYAEHALGELVPKVEDSAVTVQLVPRRPESHTDIKLCLELGVMVMLDKPIVLVVPPGTKVPGKLVKVADAILDGDIDTDASRASLAGRLRDVVDRLGGGNGGEP